MITITGSPKEIAALVDELQERRIPTGYLKSSPMTEPDKDTTGAGENASTRTIRKRTDD